MTSRDLLLVGSCCLGAACYNYLPLAQPGPEPNANLAVTLTDAGFAELAAYVGPDIAVVRGRFLTTTDRGLSLSLTAVETRRGDVLSWRGETVLVPRAFLARMDERHMSTGRTVLLAGASLLGLVVSYRAFGSDGGGTGGGSGMPTPL